MISNGDMPAGPAPKDLSPEIMECHKAQGIISRNDPYYHGLTKREHFAAMAIQGLLAGGGCTNINDYEAGFISKDAVIHADALLKALETKEEG